MVNIDVCIEPFFVSEQYEKRIKNIYELGFKNYEFWFHNKRFDGKSLVDEKKDFKAISELNRDLGLTTVDFVFNHPDGGIQASLIDKNDRQKLLDHINEIISYAKEVGCKKLISGSGNKIKTISEKEAIYNMIDSLSALAEICEKQDITLVLEPFNTRIDHPDYFLDNPYTALDVIKKVNSTHIKLLFDIYHMQIMSGNITNFIKDNIQYIGHFHIAGVPGRHEPIDNEINYRFILNEIDKSGYDGYAGLEYWPSIPDKESLIKTLEYFQGK